MLEIIDFFTGKNVSEKEYKKLIYKTKNNHIYDLYKLCKKKELTVKIFVTSFVNKITYFDNEKGVRISGETFSIENNEISIYNF